MLPTLHDIYPTSTVELSFSDESHPVQQLMSRTGSFPLRIALAFLRRYARPGDTVLDPFCGRGTTLLAARFCGMRAYGSDIAPEAVICTRAKIGAVTLDSVLDYLSGIRLGARRIGEQPSEVRVFFHDETLRQIVLTARRLRADAANPNPRLAANATFALAALLGILHGHASYSLSISSAHAYSMSPAYVSRYAREHGLRKPLRDVLECVAAKVERTLCSPLPIATPSRVAEVDASRVPQRFRSLVGVVDVILTSPPYLDSQTYAKDNWLRLWLLGYDFRSHHALYVHTASPRRYVELMLPVLASAKRMLRPGGRLILVAGDVRRESAVERVIQTASLLMEQVIAPLGGIRVVANGMHPTTGVSRYYHAIHRTSGHTKSQAAERYLVLEREK